MNKEVNSVYIHIPFCKKICSYCDFCKILINDEYIIKYLLALEKEVINRYMKDDIKTIYIGGGTPSCLSIPNLKKLFNIIKLFNKTYDAEITFECNLDDIREELLIYLKEEGVNRLSIGIQSFNYDKLKFLGREAEFKDAKDKIAMCRQIGFDNINIDLMYATVNETISELKNDLNKFLKLKVDHISTYSLIIEDNTKIKHDKVEYISDKLDSKMYNVIRKKLKRNNYIQYEVSNFGKTNKFSKHNLVYWNNEEYYGFGLGAAGYYAGVRYENTKNIKSYINGEYDKEQNMLSKKEIMDYELMLGFRKTEGINILDFKEKYGQEITEVYEINPLIKSKDLILKNNYIYINPKKIYVMNEILLKIF